MPSTGRKTRPTVISVVGAKGGVGTSVVALNLALALARLDHQVVLVEADLEGAGVGAMVGEGDQNQGLGQWLGAKRKKLEEIPGLEIEPRLKILSRGTPLAPPNPHPQKKRKLITGLKGLSAEFVVVELGKGLLAQDLALAAHGCLVVFTPEPTALVGLKNLVTALALRTFEQNLRDNSRARTLLEEFRYSGKEIAELVQQLSTIEGLRPSPGELIGRMRIKLLANRVKSLEEMACARQGAQLIHQATGIIAEVAGFIPEDPLVPDSLAAASPALEINPRARFSMALALVALELKPWAGRGNEWAERLPEPGSFERTASSFAPIFQEG